MENKYANFGLPSDPTNQPSPSHQATAVQRGWFSRNFWWLLAAMQFAGGFLPLLGRITLLFVLPLSSSTVFADEKVGWVTAYWAGWARMSPNDVAWRSYTHLCIFSATPDARGGCKLGMGWNDNRVKAAIATAHRHNVKVLLCVGGAGTGRNFAHSTSLVHLR